MTDSYDIVLDLIAKGLRGEISLAELANVHLNDAIESHPLLSEAVHVLEHFIADADIRKRDAEYDSLQRDELAEYRRRISDLKNAPGFK